MGGPNPQWLPTSLTVRCKPALGKIGGAVHMSEHNISPSSVTKPIQLLAAWLVGLLSLNASFLLTATNIKNPEWASGFLVICSAVNVPVFLLCLFMLQTRFRPEMQEDQFYSKYIEKKYSIETGKAEVVEVDVKMTTQSAITIAKPDLIKIEKKDITSRIYVNDLLSCYPEIIQSLMTKGYKIYETFGSTNEEPEKPDKFMLSVTKDIPSELFREMVDISSKFGVELVATVNYNIMYNSIYIGSYSYRSKESKHIEFNDDIKGKIMSGALTPEIIDAMLNGVKSED